MSLELLKSSISHHITPRTPIQRDLFHLCMGDQYSPGVEKLQHHHSFLSSLLQVHNPEDPCWCLRVSPQPPAVWRCLCVVFSLQVEEQLLASQFQGSAVNEPGSGCRMTPTVLPNSFFMLVLMRFTTMEARLAHKVVEGVFVPDLDLQCQFERSPVTACPVPLRWGSFLP